MKTTYKFIRFEAYDLGLINAAYKCLNKKHGTILGIVELESTWKQYVFVPNPLTMYSKGCLEDIADFLGQLNRAESEAPNETDS